MTVIKNAKKGKKSLKKKELDILSVIDECTGGEDATEWSGTLREYLPLVIENPYLNEMAHARICRMVETDGFRFDEKDEYKKNPMYDFFKKELFGVDHVLAQIMQYFKAAAAGSEVSRRILLLWGPTSSGKSQFAITLKKGLEMFSKTAEGMVFAINGCPMHENPLNAIPLSARVAIREKFGLVIEGELCPRCAYRLKEEFGGDFWKLPVSRVFMSEMNRIGIGTFQPGDTKCTRNSMILLDKGLQDISTLGVENEESIEQQIFLSDGQLTGSTKFFRYEDRDTLKIGTNLGYNIEVTPNHPLMIVDNNGDFLWKNSEELSLGDTLVMAKGQGFNFIREELPSNDLGIKWTPTFAKFVGLYIAEGSFVAKGSGLEISNCNENIQKMVKEFAEEYGIKSTLRKKGKGVFLWNRKLVDFMKRIGFTTGAHLKYIPDVCFTSGYLKEILFGMWLGDGNVGKHANKNTNEAIYSTVSPLLSQQVHLLLLTLGIPSNKIHYPNVGTSGAYKILVTGDRVKQLIDCLNIPEWKYTRPLANVASNENVFLLPRIDDLAKEVCKSTKFMSEWHRYTVSTKSYGRRFSVNSLKKFTKDASENGCNNNSLNKLKELSNKKYLYVQITSISEGKGDVYDIEVPEHHCFIANGFISHNSQSQSELVGSVNFARLEDFGVESHPMAYNFDGELNVANRGVMEFIEMLKVDPKFRHILLTLAQEKRIKVERFPLIYADLVPIAHTNECEYNKFIATKTEEALHDRLWVVKFPYNLKLNEEVRIYEKLICQTPGFKDVHIAPHTLHVAAMFAILSRMEEPKDKGITLLQKMRLYNGEHVDGFSPENVKELQEEAEREGLDGISPRYVVNRLAACFAKHDVKSVTPISAIRSIQAGLPTNAKLNKEEVARLEDLITECIEEYSKIATNEVQKAFFVNFEHEIKTLLSNYIDNIGAFLDDTKVENEWGDMVESDERLMRKIEEKVEITSSGKESFRQEVYRKMIKNKSETGDYDYQSHPKLKEALQKQLFSERKDVIKLTVSSRNPDPEGLKKINEVVAVLIDKYGYNAESANELLRYVSDIMSQNS
jgi:predicted Ser/Thr protein kinase